MDVFVVLAKNHLDSVVAEQHPSGARRRRKTNGGRGASGIRSRRVDPGG
jgi:hypothetical protein